MEDIFNMFNILAAAAALSLAFHVHTAHLHENTFSLFEAIKNGETNKVKELLPAKVGVHARDSEGWSPLRNALCYDYKYIARYLINNHADVKELDTKGHTLLYFAVIQKSKDFVKLLLEHRATFSDADHSALGWGYEDNLKEMLATAYKDALNAIVCSGKDSRQMHYKILEGIINCGIDSESLEKIKNQVLAEDKMLKNIYGDDMNLESSMKHLSDIEIERLYEIMPTINHTINYKTTKSAACINR